ncbi:DNA helicase UvrD [Patescibacteria group bacterium]|nr:DNA helicase UvrD [Patescibacteria group bacterium]
MPKFVTDLHLHSAYARATSRNLNFDTLSEWAKMKGISLLSSADFTHPVWWEETKSKLKESDSPGFYKYRGTHFVLGTEISCIYSQGGKVRRIHCLLFFPEKKDVQQFNDHLGTIGNLKADGRPIIGISAKQLLEIALNVNEKAIFIPAHVWTPWFSLYGSNSGFDSIEECFGDLSKYIYAVETGLSSDPAMNWRIPELDNRSIVSFSDAHSTPKMSRELTIFDTNFDYAGLLEALKRQKISLTIEFFPEEGKYHFTGHRNCKVRHSPEDTANIGVICPNCKKKLTVGVMHRVEQLADKNRPENFQMSHRPQFKRLVPLLEILAEATGVQVGSNKVHEEYRKLVGHFGSEMNILLKAQQTDLEKASSVYRIVEGIDKVRKGDIVVEPGYDGVFGVVRIWPRGEEDRGDPRTRSETIVKQADGQDRLPGL